ncbi:MAG: hypothetical protein ACLQO7_12505, partial [Candidatus Bathyarchaeia archaeon]
PKTGFVSLLFTTLSHAETQIFGSCKTCLKQIGDEYMLHNDICPNCKSTAETELLIKNEQEIYTVCSTCKRILSKSWL